MESKNLFYFFYVSASLWLISPDTATATGPIQGAKNTGMGTAFVAVADDPSAIAVNPAGLTQLKGTNIYGGISLMIPSTTYMSPSPHDWKNSWLIKFGGDFKVNEKLSLRAGYVYVESPVPDHTLDPVNPESTQHNINIGFGYTMNTYTLDFFYNAGFQEDRKVNNTILSGKYKNFVHYTGISVGKRF